MATIKFLINKPQKEKNQDNKVRRYSSVLYDVSGDHTTPLW